MGPRDRLEGGAGAPALDPGHGRGLRGRDPEAGGEVGEGRGDDIDPARAVPGRQDEVPGEDRAILKLDDAADAARLVRGRVQGGLEVAPAVHDDGGDGLARSGVDGLCIGRVDVRARELRFGLSERERIREDQAGDPQGR